jgi:hypothetical protein
VKAALALLIVLSALLGYVATHGGRMPPHHDIKQRIAGWKWPGSPQKAGRMAGFSWGDGPGATRFDNGG